MMVAREDSLGERSPLATIELLPFTERKHGESLTLSPALEQRDKEILGFSGYCAPAWKMILRIFLGIITLGFTFLLERWFLSVRLLLALRPCELRRADYVLVKLTDKRQDIAKVTKVASFTSIDIHATTHLLSDDEPAAGFNQPSVVKGDAMDRFLDYRCRRYLYSHAVGLFVPVPTTPPDLASQLVIALNNPRLQGQMENDWERIDRKALYGSNELNVPVKSILELVSEEMVHPFYVFQYASVAIWCIQQYYSYSAIIVAITLASILSTAIQAHRYRKRLSALAHYACEVQVVRENGICFTSSTELVPGDVVVLTPGVLPCDIVLMKGEAIVDENMLTGEAVPVRKVPYNPAAGGIAYDADDHKSCTLYGGTTVAQVRPGGTERRGLGIVARTGFSTAKGQLLRSILFPREHKMHFVSDAMRFIAAMLCLGLLFYIWDVIALAAYGASAGFIIVKYLDLITIAVPPALPACLTVATAIAVSRLQGHGIFVSSPAAVTMAGHLDIICFDKTGTLTQSGLELAGVVPVVKADKVCDSLKKAGAIPPMFQELLATCHGLAQLGDSLVGDPLDQRLFECTGWRMMDDGGGEPVEITTLTPEKHGQCSSDAPPSPNATIATAHVRTRVRPPGGDGNGALSGTYAIVRRFEFTSEKARNGVIVSKPDGTLHFFAKGSPEAMRKLCESSTLPLDFDQELLKHTRHGLRVIGMAAKQLTGITQSEAQSATQKELEDGLQFIGFAVLVNPLRSDTESVIEVLHAADIRTVMVTGDHANTAMSMAHQCGILPAHNSYVVIDTSLDEGRIEDADLSIQGASPDGTPLAGTSMALLTAVSRGDMEASVTGRGFRKLWQSQGSSGGGGGGLDTALNRGGVFARMSPDDKRNLVELLGDGAIDEHGEKSPGLGHCVGFCGDGANDVGALKGAHVGVSLCEAEASVAAPLTSKQQTIACMLTVVAEGRCSLSTSYLIFKFVIVYAFIQVFAVAVMYSFGGSVGNFQYLIQDLLYTTVLAGVMGFTGPAKKLSKQRPPSRLMSLGIWMPVAAQFLTVAFFQTIALVFLRSQHWYVQFDPSPDDGEPSCFSREETNSARCSESYENSAIFLMSLGQFLITALVFNKGFPHRKPLYTNTWLLLALIGQSIFLAYLMLSPGDNWMTRGFAGLVPFPSSEFRIMLVAILLVNIVTAYMVDHLADWCWRRLKGKTVCGVTVM